MRVLYLSRTYTTHDRRFLAAIGAAHDTHFARLEDDGVVYERRPLPAGVGAVEWGGGRGPVADYGALLRLAPGLERAFAEVRPDVVHAGPVPTCAFLAALAGAGSPGGPPLVAMSWGSDLLLDADRDAGVGWAARWALGRAARLVCDATAVREKAAALAAFPGERVVQFPWGVDTERYRPGPDGSGLRARLGWQGATVVVSTRSWAPVYGVDVALRAFARAHRQRPGLRLLLVGDGPLAPDVERIIGEEGIGDAVHRPGRVGQDRLPDLFRAADLYLSCAESDGTSISLLEAMGTGLPVVVTDAPGNREWVGEGNGRLAPAGDADAFAEALVGLAALGAPARSEVADRNRQSVLDRADWDRNVGRLLEAYTALAG